MFADLEDQVAKQKVRYAIIYSGQIDLVKLTLIFPLDRIAFASSVNQFQMLRKKRVTKMMLIDARIKQANFF